MTAANPNDAKRECVGGQSVSPPSDRAILAVRRSAGVHAERVFSPLVRGNTCWEASHGENVRQTRPEDHNGEAIWEMSADTGYFQVMFPGPGENLDRISVPETQLRVTPAVEAQLNERQRKMVLFLVQGEELTSRKCERSFSVTRDTANRDFTLLMRLGLVMKSGRGRSTHYVLAEATANRQVIVR